MGMRSGLRRGLCGGGQRGSSLLEYTVVLTVMLAMLFGVIDFGRALYAYHFVSDAAREGTRYAMVRGSTCNQGCIQTYLENVPAGIDATQLSVTPSWPNGGCNTAGCPVRVQVSYNFNFLLPFLPKSTLVMQSSSQMVISQ